MELYEIFNISILDDEIVNLLFIFLIALCLVLELFILLLVIRNIRMKRKLKERFSSIFYSTAFEQLEPVQKEEITQIARDRGITVDTYVTNIIKRDIGAIYNYTGTVNHQ